MINVLLHRLLIERDAPVDTEAVKTKKALEKSGLAVPPTVQEQLDKQEGRESASMDKGVVVQIGETAFRDFNIECPVQVGDHIIYAQFGGKQVTDPETEKRYVVINDEDVVAIIGKVQND